MDETNVINGYFTPEEQDLVGKIDALVEAAENRLIVSLAFVTQTDDGSYEMDWTGDVEFPSTIEALKVLIRNLRRAAAQQAKRAME